MDPFTAVDLKGTITDSVIDVFDTMLSVEVRSADAETPVDQSLERYVGVVKFVGEMVGIVSILISSIFARTLTAEMMGISEDEIESEEEINDLIAELSNIIGGKLKSSYTDIGLYCELSPPSITKGSDFTIESLNMERYERFSFTHDSQTILVEAGIKQGSAESEEIKAEKSKKPRRPIDLEKYRSLDLKQLVENTVLDVFETMLALDVQTADTVSRSSTEGVRTVGSVNFAGDITGIINIHVSNDFARRMTASMLGMEPDEIEGQEEIKDLIGELSNIIGGSIKSSYTDTGLICELSTPSITTGKDFLIESLNMSQYERLAFKSGSNDFFVELGIKIPEGMLPGKEDSKSVHYAVEDDAGEADHQVDEPAAEPEVPVKAAGAADPAPAEPAGSDRSASSPAAAEVGTRTQQPAGGKSNAVFEPKTEAPASINGTVDMDVILDIPLDITVELGRTRMPIHELLGLDPGSAVTLSRLEGEPVDIFANDTLIAKGIVLVKGEKYAIQIVEITSRLNRIRSLY